MTAVFYVGDALETMAKFPEKSVDLVLTSPPFLALRSYLPADHPDKSKEGGSQATPGEFIDWLIDIAEACNWILAPHGSMCIELGDTYSGSGGAGGDYGPDGLREGQPTFKVNRAIERPGIRSDGRSVGDTKSTIEGTIMRNQGGNGWPLAKSLSLIPELFRFSLVYGFNPLTGRQTERWRLRNVVRWVRPNPPVGALGDKFRPATSELMVFCKSAKRYFDLDAVRTESAHSPTKGNSWGPDETKIMYENPLGAPPLDWWEIPPGGYEGAHYAVFPPELCVKPIKAMSPERVCRVCGEPSRRIVEKTYQSAFVPGPAYETPDTWKGDRSNPRERRPNGTFLPREGYENQAKTVGRGGVITRMGDGVHVETLGFSDCGHDDWRPGVVFDPFAGSGTTLAVATGHGRDAIGIDLDARNFDLALERVGPFILSKGEAA